MCSSKAAFFATALGLFAFGKTAAEPPILTAPRKPFAFSGGVAAGPDDKVWSAVVLASKSKKGEHPVASAPELAPFVAKLTKRLGYDQFEVLGSATKTMDEESERWLVPTQNFWVCARANHEGGGYRLNIQLFHDKRRLLNVETMLCPKSPGFFCGPMHARGQIIVVFEVKP